MTNKEIINALTDINDRIDLVERSIYTMKKTGIIKEKEVSYSSAMVEISQLKLSLRVLMKELDKKEEEVLTYSESFPSYF